MQHFTMYQCRICGQVRAGPSLCTYCETPLTEYRTGDEEDFQLNMQEAMRVMNDRLWII
jgi:hypothetical protein